MNKNNIPVLFNDECCMIGLENEDTPLLAANVDIELNGYKAGYINVNDYSTLYVRKNVIKEQIKNNTVLNLFKNFVTVE